MVSEDIVLGDNRTNIHKNNMVVANRRRRKTDRYERRTGGKTDQEKTGQRTQRREGLEWTAGEKKNRSWGDDKRPTGIESRLADAML